jgi:hypothetical protein
MKRAFALKMVSELEKKGRVHQAEGIVSLLSGLPYATVYPNSTI